LKRTILIVDDEEDLRSLLKSSLEEEFEIYEAKDGQEGFNLALEKKPDLIISDIKMPNLNGFEMVSKLRQEEVFSAVIFITAFGDFSKQAEATRLAAFDFLEKPVMPAKLLQTVKNALLMGSKLISTLTSGEAVVLGKEKEYGPYVINNMPNSLIEKLQSYCATRGLDPQKLIIQWISDQVEKA
jgi:DNA-binding NtrC family response regulator